MHVHFREPGFEYKEDILTGSAAAAAGGVTSCCYMANTSPVLDNADIIKSLSGRVNTAAVNCFPVGAVTLGLEGKVLTDFAALKAAGVVALSDDGIPIRDPELMERALQLAKELDLLIISHCEDEAEMAERDVYLAEKVNARLHIAHVSLSETVDIVRRAKARGVMVTAETCPHYFSLTSDEVSKQGAMACMNPPLAASRDIDAVIKGLCDGTIDAIATDHAPHSAEEKSLPVGRAPNGIIGLETSLGVSLTYLYHSGFMELSEVIALMTTAPARILGLEAGRLEAGRPADIILFDPNEQWTVDAGLFKSKAHNTPFGGKTLKGKVRHTFVRGESIPLQP
ncbi:MAG: dihydroorotase [Oscillospiraceae bacterium]|nr:dihydroorotase [Oscillospiraceae bacterium]